MELTVYVKDSTKDMKEVKSDSVDLIITSPPYWNRKDYNHPDQLGFGMSYEEYITGLFSNLHECIRVMKVDGFATFVVADVRPKACEISKGKNIRPKLFPIHSDIISFFNRNGIELYEQFIWKKTSTKKGAKRYIIYGAVSQGYVYPPYLYGDMTIEYILVFRKPGLKRQLPILNERIRERIPRKLAQDWLDSIWFIDPVKHPMHPAVFPPELPERLIKLYSLEGYTILDPFSGVGTTLKVAIDLNRNAIGYELNYAYISDFIEQYKICGSGYKYSKKIYTNNINDV